MTVPCAWAGGIAGASQIAAAVPRRIVRVALMAFHSFDQSYSRANAPGELHRRTLKSHGVIAVAVIRRSQGKITSSADRSILRGCNPARFRAGR
jgi:hypothetical protein